MYSSEVGNKAALESTKFLTGFPIHKFETSEYLELLFFYNYEEEKRVNKIFHKAISLIKKRKKKKAIALLNKIKETNPNFSIPYCTIADTFADLKDFETSFSFYKKALKLVPNDPFIIKNFAITLNEAKVNFEGLEKLLDLYEKYPMIEDNIVVFERSFNWLSNFGFLKKEEIIKLKNRWDKLN